MCEFRLNGHEVGKADAKCESVISVIVYWNKT